MRLSVQASFEHSIIPVSFSDIRTFDHSCFLFRTFKHAFTLPDPDPDPDSRFQIPHCTFHIPDPDPDPDPDAHPDPDPGPDPGPDPDHTLLLGFFCGVIHEKPTQN